MRDLFPGALKLIGWLSFLGTIIYGYILASAPPVDAGFFGIVIGAFVGGAELFLFLGLAELAATIWANERRLIKIEEKLFGSAEERKSDAIFGTLDRVKDTKDLVLAIQAALPKAAPHGSAPVVESPKIDLSEIKTSENK